MSDTSPLAWVALVVSMVGFAMSWRYARMSRRNLAETRRLLGVDEEKRPRP